MEKINIEELYIKLDLVKQAVIDIDEYVDIIDEVLIFLDKQNGNK